MVEPTIEELRREREALLDLLEGAIAQACQDGPRVDSHALTAYSAALLKLAEVGRFTIEAHTGRRIIGRWRHRDA